MDPRTQHELIALLPRLRRFALGLAGDGAMADELVQMACEKAISRIHQWEVGTRLDSWMFRIVQTTYLDHLRRLKSRGEHVDIDDQPHLSAHDGENVAVARLTLERTRQAMQLLPQEHKSVMMLVCIEGYAYKDAAAILDIPMGTLTSRLARARNALLALLNDTDETDTPPSNIATVVASGGH